MADSRAQQLRKRPTDAERALWQQLRSKQLPAYRFRRQAPIGHYIVDFACFHPRLVVELDGGQHGQPKQQHRDEVRTTWLEHEGFRVIRFWNHDVLQHTDAVATEILRTLDELSSN